MSGGIKARLLTLLSSFLFCSQAFAMNGRTTYQAKIAKPNGYPLEAASVNFRFTVLDTVGSCILYVEDYAAINMMDTKGLISFSLGNGTRTFPTSGTSQTFQTIFDNSIPSFACQNAGIYLPGPNDVRKIVMQFDDGTGWQTLPAMTINSVPYAMYANQSNNAKTLNNKSDTAFVEYTTLAALGCQSDEALRFNGASFSCVSVAASATSVIAALGYTPVQSVSATAPLASSGGSTPTISIAQATSSADGYLSATDWTTFNNKQTATAAAIIATLGYTPADNSVSGTYLQKSNNLSDLTNVATARTNLGLGSFAIANSVDLGSASATGIIADARLADQSAITSGTQYTKVTVDGKGRVTAGSNLSASDVTTALGYVPVTPTDIAETVTSGTVLTLAMNAMTTSVFNLTNTVSSIVSSQWVTSGTTINYTAGNVGIGTANPTAKLHVRDASAGVSTGADVLKLESAYDATVVGSGGNIRFSNSMAAIDAAAIKAYTNGTGDVSLKFQTGYGALADRMTIANNGNVGIGTTNPGAKLEVVGGGASYANAFKVSTIGAGGSTIILGDDATNGDQVRIGVNGYLRSQAGRFGVDSTGAPITFEVNGSEKMRVAPGGNVGVGTASPDSLMHLKSTSAWSILKVQSAQVPVIHLYSDQANGGMNRNWSIVNNYSSIGGLEFDVSTTEGGNPIGNTKMLITNSGNVGIGTTTPAAKLDVQGQVKTSMGTPLVNPAGNAVDFATGNTQYVTFSSCPGNVLTVNLYSMFEGSSYSIVIVAPSSCLVDFTGTTNANGGSGGTAVTAFKYPAGQKFSSTGNPMVYSFLRANNFVFVAQVVDFQ